MKKILLPILTVLTAFSMTACGKKTTTSKTTTKAKTNTVTKKKRTKVTTTKRTATTTEYKERIYLFLDFGIYNTYYVDQEYLDWHYVDEINKDCFLFDLKWDLYNFKGWAYNRKIIFDENGNKVNDFKPEVSMVFDAIFEPIDELKEFVYDLGMGSNTFDIFGFQNDTSEVLASKKEIYIPGEVTWDGQNYKIYRFRKFISKDGGGLVGCNNVEKLTIPYANGINSSGFLSSPFACLWGTKEFDNSYKVKGYYLRSNVDTEYTEAYYYIPKSLKTLKLTGDIIATHTFSNYNELKDVEFIITNNMRYIYQNAFYGITEQLTIYFEGSIAEYNAISVHETGNDAWNNANVYFYSEEEPGDGGSFSYFHYDENGDIAIWE